MSILLLREQESKDKFHHEFENNGYQVESIPVLSYVFVNIDHLRSIVSSLDRYGGIIFTSKRAVQAFTSVVDSSLIDVIKKNNINIYTVGRATETELESLNLSSLGGESGNAKDLSKVIITKEQASANPLLFLCGNIARDTIPTALLNAEIPYDSIVVYETHPHKQFEQNFNKYIQSKKLDIIAFFSPSGAEFFLPFIKMNVENFETVKIVCIGKTTADAIINMNAIVLGIAKKPTPQCLVEAVKIVLEER